MHAAKLLSLGPWTADLASGLLTGEHASRQLSPRATALLRALAEEAGSVVPTLVLQGQLQFEDAEPVSIHVLRRTVLELRAALAATAPPALTLDAVAKRGYRLVLPGATYQAAATPATGAPAPTPTSTPAPAGWRDRRTLALVASALLVLLAPLLLRAVTPVATLATPAEPAEPPATVHRIVLAIDDLQLLERDPATLAMAAQLGTRLRQAIQLIDHGFRRREALVIDLVRGDDQRTANAKAERADGDGSTTVPTHRLAGALQREATGSRVRFALYRADEAEPLYVFQETFAAGEDSDRATQRYATEVADGLQILLDPHASARMKSVGTRSIEAFRLFEEAYGLTVFPISGAVLRRKNRLLAEAIVLDEDFAAALEAHTLVHSIRARLELEPRVRTEAYRELQALRHGRTLAVMDPGFGRQMDVALALLADVPPRERVPLVVQAHLLGATSRFGTPLPLDLVDMLIGARLPEQAMVVLAQVPDTHREGWNVDRRTFVLLLRQGAAAALPSVHASLRNDIAGEAIAAVLLQATGEGALAQRALGRLVGADDDGYWATGTLAQLRALGGRQPLLAAAVAQAKPLPWFAGNAAFMRGDVAAGVDAWRGMGPPEVTIASFYQPLYELAFPAAVTKDPRYQAELDRLGIGRQLSTKMKEVLAGRTSEAVLTAPR